LFLLGVLSIFQVAFLPGYLVIRLLKIADRLLKTLILSFSVSLVVNHYLVVLLTAIGIYNRTAIFSIFVGEMAVFVWLTRHHLNMPLLHYYDLLKGKLGLSWDDLKSCTAIIKYFFVAVSLTYFTYNFIGNIGGVHDGVDALLSWNRWAIDWYNGKFPNLTWHYPQLLPSNWSISYIFIGTYKIQFFATAIIQLFPLFSLLALLDLWNRKKEAAFLYAIPVLGIIYIIFLFGIINQGFADIPVAYMSFISIYTLLNINIDDTRSKIYKHLFIGLFCCAGAALTKQAGLYLLSIYPLFWFSILYTNKINKLMHAIYIIVCSYILLACLVAPWYLYVTDRINKGLDASEISYVTNDIFKGADIITRYNNSINTIVNDSVTNMELFLIKNNINQIDNIKKILVICLIIIAYLLICGVFNGISRQLLFLLIVPYYILWSLYFSYDIRNIALILPVIGLVVGYGINVNVKIISKLLFKDANKSMVI